jgi:hypothetical protein
MAALDRAQSAKAIDAYARPHLGLNDLQDSAASG